MAYQKPKPGFCTCGRKAKPGRTRCVECTIRGADWMNKRYWKRVNAGLCTKCGKVKVTKFRDCKDCRTAGAKKGRSDYMALSASKPFRSERYAVINRGGYILDGLYPSKTQAVKAMVKNFNNRSWRQIKRAYGLRIVKVEVRVID